MKRIGVLGGMSWESSLEYERVMNVAVRERLGTTHSADLIVRSYDFAEIEALQESGGWGALADRLSDDARVLQVAGAELIIIATNTMHVVAPQVQAAIDIPLLHIADATSSAVRAARLDTVGLLGTRYTMELPFYRERLTDSGIAVIVPDEPDRSHIHDIIYRELVRGIVSPESRAECLRIIASLRTRGAQGIVGGCTEIELLVRDGDTDLPFFPTARLHALAAVEAALAE